MLWPIVPGTERCGHRAVELLQHKFKPEIHEILTAVSQLNCNSSIRAGSSPMVADVLAYSEGSDGAGAF